jgi:ABC-type uncharacterized transport system substrate-binding protein
MRFSCALALSWLVLAALAAPARAHPHVWVKAHADIVFNGEGKVAAIRHRWAFDDMYSAFAIQGLPVGPDGKLTPQILAPIAKQNMEDLKEFDYFTRVRAGGVKMSFGAPTGYSAEQEENGVLVLRFTLPLRTPASAGAALVLQIYDPSFFVDFEFDEKDPVSLVSAPSGCSTNFMKPRPLDAADQRKLNESFFTNLAPGTDFGIKMAGRIILACP